MDPFADYSLDDFLENDAFVRWVKYPDAGQNRYWQQVASAHPHLVPVMDEARRRIREMAQFYPDVPESDVTDLWQRVQGQIRPQPVRRFRPLWWAAAGIALVAGWFIWDTGQPVEKVREMVASVSGSATREIRNTGTQVQIITLSDGSTVSLEPSGTLRFDTTFRERREVYLSGDAFFQVRKDPAHPFFVYANGLVTKVLGTSFRVTAYERDPRVTVQVRTGKVAVYPSEAAGPHPESAGLLLTPNQQASFLREELQLSRGLIQDPRILVPKENLKRFVFDDAPLSEIFDALEKAYGVRIVYDEEVFARCRITTSLTDEVLFEKLNVLCKVIGATYQVVDAQIVVSGSGCTE
ncbi:FecR family protein [Siphonobacter aquaeclarae]|uniref:FecR family protein n=1 Tax=Siphonobacter aquaeclarae TaxID=563176 RepID=A0A1G9HEL2_9BACT|nr:FecR domain-containing protein [Siphonobacter aquaeclarae]MBO9638216.1 FecR domain-containing protein [Siphonobacter aquaeclarae]SDL11430.1 FecR family protein [Siphonobacter aquaeclarae]